MKDHYKTLGVDRNATPDEIKKAYRARSRQHHPDKGGSHDEFTDINSAYQTLSDPERRLLYDGTGQDRQVPLETEAGQMIMALFAEALQLPHDVAVVKYVRGKIDIGDQNIAATRGNLATRRAKLEKKRDKVKTKDGVVNLVHQLIDGELRAIEGQSANMDRQAALHKEMRKQLDAYEEEFVEVRDMRRGNLTSLMDLVNDPGFNPYRF